MDSSHPHSVNGAMNASSGDGHVGDPSSLLFADLSSVEDEPLVVPTSTITTDVDQTLESHIGMGKSQYIASGILGLANAADASEIIAVGFVLDAFRESSPVSSVEEGLLTAAIFVGMLFGGLFMGFFGDRFGRKRALSISLFINSIGGMGSAAAPSTWVLVLLRVLSGIGVGGSIPPMFSLAVELCPPSARGKCVVWIAMQWAVGSMYTGGCAWVIMGKYDLSWRYFALLAALPAFVCFLLTTLFVPESPQYLANAGKFDDALEILQKMSMKNGRKLPLHSTLTYGYVANNLDMAHDGANPVFSSVRLPAEHGTGIGQGAGEENDQFDWIIGLRNRWTHGVQLQHEATITGTPATATATATASTASTAKYPAADASSWSCGRELRRIKHTVVMMWRPSLRKATVPLLVAWFTLAFSSYGLSIWIPTIFDKTGFEANKYMSVFVYCAAQLPGCIVSALLIDHPKVGRRGLLGVSALFASIFTIIFAMEHSTVVMAVAMSSMFQFCTTITWAALDALAAESFPIALRTSAFSIQGAFGRVGSITGQILFSRLIDESVAGLIATCSGMLLICSICGLFMPKENALEGEKEGGPHHAVAGPSDAVGKKSARAAVL